MVLSREGGPSVLVMGDPGLGPSIPALGDPGFPDAETGAPNQARGRSAQAAASEQSRALGEREGICREAPSMTEPTRLL